MKYGKIKVGDVVKYNYKAKKEILSAIDNDEHIVKEVYTRLSGTEYVNFLDGSSADVYWLVKVKSKK